MSSGPKPIEAHLVTRGFDAGRLTDDDRQAIAHVVVDAATRWRGGIIRKQSGEFRRLDPDRAYVLLVPLERPKSPTGRDMNRWIDSIPRPLTLRPTRNLRTDPKPVEGHLTDLGLGASLLTDDDRSAIAEVVMDAVLTRRGVLVRRHSGEFRRIDPARTRIFFVSLQRCQSAG